MIPALVSLCQRASGVGNCSVLGGRNWSTAAVPYLEGWPQQVGLPTNPLKSEQLPALVTGVESRRCSVLQGLVAGLVWLAPSVVLRTLLTVLRRWLSCWAQLGLHPPDG